MFKQMLKDSSVFLILLAITIILAYWGLELIGVVSLISYILYNVISSIIIDRKRKHKWPYK